MASRGESRSTWASVGIILLVLLGLESSACATKYVVGGTSGWTELAPGSISYDEEFKNIVLFVGDSLEFSAAPPASPGNQSVLRVPEAQLANCNGTNFLASVDTNVIMTREDGSLAPSMGTSFNAYVSVLLNETGYWGFISADEEQCKRGGMHLAVNVTAPAPGSAPSTRLGLVNPTPVTASASSPSSQQTSPNHDDSNGANSLVSAPWTMLLAFAVASLAILVTL